MERVGVLMLVGVGVVGAAMGAAARWAPGALQPAGARSELAKLMVQAVDEAETVIGDWLDVSDTVQEEGVLFAAEPEVTEPLLTPTLCRAPGELELAPLLPQRTSSWTVESGGHVRVVVYTSGERARVVAPLVRLDSFKKS
jgi:hypothetical protein